MIKKLVAGLGILAGVSLGAAHTTEAAYPPGPYSVTVDRTCEFIPPEDGVGFGENIGTAEFTFTGANTGVPIKIVDALDKVLYEGTLESSTQTVVIDSKTSDWSIIHELTAFIADESVTADPCPIADPFPPNGKYPPGSGSGSGTGTNGGGTTVGGGQTTLPDTGTGIGVASIGVALVAAGAALTSLSRRRNAQTS